MKFEQLGDIRYKAIVDSSEEQMIREIISRLSKGNEDSYEDMINQTFIDSLVSRYVSACFFTQIPINDAYFTTIEVPIFGRVVEVSVGSVPITENTYKKTSGVLYR